MNSLPLQSVGVAVVVEPVVVGALFVYALCHHPADAIAGGEPDAAVAVFGNAADVVVAEARLLCQMVQHVVLRVQYVHALSGAHPDESA